MNKTELIATISENTEVSKKDTEKVVLALIDTITDVLKAGDKVQLVGFGSFEVKHRAERMGRNPKTKEQITIPASTVPVFKAGKAFKEVVDGKTAKKTAK